MRIEHKVLKTLKEQLPAGARCLLAVSGGADSLAMAEILYRWRRHLKIELCAAYVHHGESDDIKLHEFRAQAAASVREWARSRRVKFITNKSTASKLNGEAVLRAFRYRALRRWARELNCTVIVLAHHRDDLLETRVLRLIRGVGENGLEAMRVRRQDLLRPLLSVTRAELREYASLRNLKWSEDPTNSDTECALRNWVRHEWLPRLESKQKGATKSLARSLELLTPENTSDFTLNPYVGLRRKPISEMAPVEQQRAVATFFRAVGLQSYARTHVEEAVKRLRTRKKVFTFELLGFRFHVTPDLVWASRV